MYNRLSSLLRLVQKLNHGFNSKPESLLHILRNT